MKRLTPSKDTYPPLARQARDTKYGTAVDPNKITNMGRGINGTTMERLRWADPTMLGNRARPTPGGRDEAGEASASSYQGSLRPH